MHRPVTIATAGNVLPGALACLRRLGYEVSISDSGALCQARSAHCTLVAEDLVALLGLAKLHEMRGDDWRPTDEEVDAFLAFDAAGDSPD